MELLDSSCHSFGSTGKAAGGASKGCMRSHSSTPCKCEDRDPFVGLVGLVGLVAFPPPAGVAATAVQRVACEALAGRAGERVVLMVVMVCVVAAMEGIVAVVGEVAERRHAAAAERRARDAAIFFFSLNLNFSLPPGIKMFTKAGSLLSAHAASRVCGA